MKTSEYITSKFQLLLLQDKLGPFCRTAADCAVILDAIKGKDPDDLSSREIAFEDPFSVDITKLTVGYTKDADMKVKKIVKYCLRSQ